ncbi:MAG: hypothetical protein ACO20A_10680, partial [Candidatus Nanopelagicales bacterium]
RRTGGPDWGAGRFRAVGLGAVGLEGVGAGVAGLGADGVGADGVGGAGLAGAAAAGGAGAGVDSRDGVVGDEVRAGEGSRDSSTPKGAGDGGTSSTISTSDSG